MSEAPPALGDYFDNILEQPQALRDTVAGLHAPVIPAAFAARLESGALGSVILTGMGASYHALHPLTLTLIAHGIAAQQIETSELLYHAPRLLHSRSLVIAVSQSGQSVETLKLLERTRAEKIPVIGVTNTADGTLARGADSVVLTRAGAEYSVSSKTYIATLAALELLGAALLGREPGDLYPQLEQTAAAMGQYLSRSQEHLAQLREMTTGIEQLILVGRGPSLAAVGTGSLIIQEAAHFPCLGMSSASLRHGPIEMLSSQSLCIVMQGIPPTIELNLRLAADLQNTGARVGPVSQSSSQDVFALPPVAPAMLPLMEFLVPEMLSVALAVGRGRTPGKFERIGKVTTKE